MIVGLLTPQSPAGADATKRGLRQPPRNFANLRSRGSSAYGRLACVDKYEELRLRILQGESDANIDFDDLRRLLLRLGFEERIRGSHHIFRKQGVMDLVNLQQEGNKAKVYQVRQVRRTILRYGLVAGDR